MIGAAASAVGINMTFLLPYSMLRKGWRKEHRGLAIYDLSIGLIVPFVIATGCVVIAAASQFHAQSDDVFALADSYEAKLAEDPNAKMPKAVKSFNGFVDGLNSSLNKEDVGPLDAAIKAAKTEEEKGAAKKAKGAKMAEYRSTTAEADRKIAAMVAERDNSDLALTLEPIAGAAAQKVFGIGVLGMAVSTIIILMLINGFAVCEAFGKEPVGNWHRVGSLIPAVGVVGPFVWAAAAPALATPTSILGGAMLPIAYFTFLLLMNSKTLGDSRPRGAKAIRWNVLMVIATVIASFASSWALWHKGTPGKIGLAILVVLFVAGLAGFISKQKKEA
jgi:hypothetical protein